jgi:4'-phosphopantetheinyl transferase
MIATGGSAPACSWEPAPQRPQLHCEEVHVWRAELARPPVEVEALKGLLSEDELRRAGRFHFQHDRSNFIIARGTLREILSLYAGRPPKLLQFGYNAFGKPELIGAPCETRVRFNLSHAGGLALYAVAAGREVGVDIEVMREGVPCEELASSFFSRREAAALSALPVGDRTHAFFECWARKEAYIKARGVGLSLPLDSFEVAVVPGKPAALLATQEGEREAARLSLHDLAVHPGYAAAVAVEDDGWHLRCWSWPCDKGASGER